MPLDAGSYWTLSVLDHAEVRLTRQGHIQCDEDGSPKWCEHIEKTIAGMLDASSWADLIGDADDGFEQHVSVPIFPTLAVFIKIRLDRITLNKRSWAANVWIDPLAVAHNYVEMGLFTEGDCLATLRSTFFNWFEAHKSELIGKRECRSMGHKWEAQSFWKQSMTNLYSTEALRQQVCIWAHGKCAYCCSNITDTFENDLLPDIDNETGPWR